jgi:antirestriction protein ArdC
VIAGNDLAKQWRAELEAEAHVRTAGVRVVITHPKFTRACPEYRNGTVRLPACLFTDPDGWQRTWRHELQHAHDDRTGWLRHLSRDEAERRARRAEFAAPRRRVW